MKTKLQLLLLAIPLAVLSMVSAALADTNERSAIPGCVEPYPYISPTPGEFPIIGWGVYSDTVYSIYKDYVDCGFNATLVLDDARRTGKMISVLNPTAGEDTIKLALIPRFDFYIDNHEPYQMPEVMDHLLDLLQERRSHANRTPTAGWFLVDEPKYYQFDRLAQYFHRIAQYDTTRMAYVNLVGDPDANGFFWDYPYKPIQDTMQVIPQKSVKLKSYVSFRKYVEDFCDKFRPGVLSYDYYPFLVKVKDNGNDTTFEDITIRDGRLGDFYTALQVYSEISKKRNRPFWAFCQCRATCVDSNTYKPQKGHPAPTEDFLRYEAFNALAFGAQGIQYWTYKEMDVPTPKPNDGSYYSLVTKDGEKTPAWYFAQRVNKEIKDHAHIFLGAKLDSYYFVGDTRDTAYCDYRRGASTQAISVRDINQRDTVGSNRGALVSTLVNGNEHYVVIVNQSPYDPVRLELELNEQDYTISRVQNLEYVRQDLAGDDDKDIKGLDLVKTERITLLPARYAIYSYKAKLASKF